MRSMFSAGFVVLFRSVLHSADLQGQSNLPPSLFNSSDRAQELIQGPSADTLDPRVDTMHVFTRVDVMPVVIGTVLDNCSKASLRTAKVEDDCYRYTKVYVRFIVERDGRLTSPAIVKGACPSFDRMALECVGPSSRWKPGLQQGVPVRVQMVMPIQFEPR